MRLLSRLSQRLGPELVFGKCSVRVSAGTSAVLTSNLRDIPQSFQTLSLKSESESESELLHDWRCTANQFVLATSLLRLATSNFIFQLNTCRL
jgi:hypothetical protein